MKITKEINGGEMKVVLEGRLDTITSPELEKALVLDGVERLVVDLAGVEYVSSAGLRVFLSAHKRMSKAGGLRLEGLRPVVREVFDITGFSDIFEIA